MQYTLHIHRVGITETGATLTDPDGATTYYDNPVSARADHYALTGIEA